MDFNNHTLKKIMDEIASEDTQGLIKKDLLLDIEDEKISLVKSERHLQEVN